jgi:hypothetical protein
MNEGNPKRRVRTGPCAEDECGVETPFLVKLGTGRPIRMCLTHIRQAQAAVPPRPRSA